MSVREVESWAASSLQNCGQGPSLGLLPAREGLPYRCSSAKERKGYLI